MTLCAPLSRLVCKMTGYDLQLCLRYRIEFEIKNRNEILLMKRDEKTDRQTKSHELALASLQLMT